LFSKIQAANQTKPIGLRKNIQTNPKRAGLVWFLVFLSGF